MKDHYSSDHVNVDQQNIPELLKAILCLDPEVFNGYCEYLIILSIVIVCTFIVKEKKSENDDQSVFYHKEIILLYSTSTP